MATIDLNSIKLNENSPDLAAEIKKLNSYLYKNNETLNYVLNNLSPEDNYSNEAYIQYQQNEKAIAKMEVSVEKIELSYVPKDGIIAAINLSEEGVKIQGKSIDLTGAVSINNNVFIDTNGCINAVNGKFSGNITGSHITGSEIGTQDGNFYMNDDGTFMCDNWSIDSNSHALNTPAVGMFWDYDGTIYCRDIYFPDSTWMKGWSLLETLKDIYNKLGSSSGGGGGGGGGDDGDDGDPLPDGPVED